MSTLINNPKILKILNPPSAENHWKDDLERLKNGDITLTRGTVGEDSVRAFQRLMIFLGYSTSSTGSFLIDGDFGRGTNRGLAQFNLENGLAKNKIKRSIIAYDCNWRTAKSMIKGIPDVSLTIPTLEKMFAKAQNAIETNTVNCGNLDEAIYQLNALHFRKYLTCREINKRYGKNAEKAAQTIMTERNISIQPEWILAIIKQETAGVVRPRFEQHWFSKFAKENPDEDIDELRFRSMSFGLGQIMGFNYKRVGASSAKELFTLPLDGQIYSIARFLAAYWRNRPALAKASPNESDFRRIARYYNGSGYHVHHYDESLARWFREFKMLRKD